MWRLFTISLISTKRRETINQQISGCPFTAFWLLRWRCIFFGRQPLNIIQKNISVKESALKNNPIVRSHPKARQGLKRPCLF